MKKIVITLFFLFICFPSYAADIFWASTTGTAANLAACESDTDPGGGDSNYCTRAQVMAITAGQTAYFKAGTYSDNCLKPSNSGSSGNVITFAAASGESVTFKHGGVNNCIFAGRYHSLYLRQNAYIVIDGIDFEYAGSGNFFVEIHDSQYNEIKNCTFDGQGDLMDISKGNVGLPAEDASTHNWIHDNTFTNNANLYWTGSEVDDASTGMNLGVWGSPVDQDSGYNTIENNTFSCGGHHNLETYSKYNVIRNNYFHNEGCEENDTGQSAAYDHDDPALYDNLWGNRNIQIYDGNNQDGMFNLVEGNRFGHAGPPPDDDGGDGMTITAPKNIIRYNDVFNSLNNGVYFKVGSNSYSNNNRFYNNSVYYSGRYNNHGSVASGQWQGSNFRFYPAGAYTITNNVIINNIFYSYGTGVDKNNSDGRDWWDKNGTIESNNTISNNWCTDADANECSANGDPSFSNTDVSEPTSSTLPNLSLQSGSNAIDNGTHLTEVAASDTGSGTSLVVDDALMFQDGSWGSSLSNIQADRICITTVSNCVAISSINYGTNTITLASDPGSRSEDDSVWLKNISDGTTVLHGNQTDQGAHEWIGPTLQGISLSQLINLAMLTD